MRKLIFIFGIMFISATGELLAQTTINRIIDSLKAELLVAKEDTTKIFLLTKISSEYSASNFDSSFYFITKAKEIADLKKTNYYEQQINSQYLEYYINNNNYSKAIEYALKNKELAEKNNDMPLLAKAYTNLNFTYNRFGQYKLAVESALKCLDISEKTKDSIKFPIRYLNVSKTYFLLNQFEKSLIYSRKALEFSIKYNNTLYRMKSLNNMAVVFSAMNNLDSAIIYHKNKLELAKENEADEEILYALINLAFEYYKKGDQLELNKCVSELNVYKNLFPQNDLIASSFVANALNFLLQKKYLEAKNELDSAYKIAKAGDEYEVLVNIYGTYSSLYLLQGNIIQGEYYRFISDSLTNDKNIKDINFYTEELETKYQTEKKESQIKLQAATIKQKNTLNYLLGGGATALALLSFIGYRNYKQRKKVDQLRITELETEKQLSATEAVLKGEEQERTRLAKDLHDGLGGMLSGIKYSFNNMKENLILTTDTAQAFSRSMDMLDNSIKEMRRVAHNMMPESLLRYGLDKTLQDYTGEINKSGIVTVAYQSMGMENINVDNTTAITIYRIVQELLNNVTKHAAAKQVLVQLLAQGNKLVVNVEDDGRGFDTEILERAEGIGWKNIKSRVEFLKGSLDVQSAHGKGTAVNMEFNI